MKNFQLGCFLALLLAACNKSDDDISAAENLLRAHTWVLDSINTKTIEAGSSNSTITKTKGDSSQTLTYYAKTFVTANPQVIERKKYRLNKLEIYYWDEGYEEHSAQLKHIIAVNDKILIEQVIRNEPVLSSTNCFLFYHAK